MNSDPRSPLCCTLRQSDAASAACVPLQTRSQCRRKRGRKLCKLLWADYFDQLLFFLLNQRSAWESQSRLYMSVAYAEAAPRALAFFLPKRGEVKHEALRLSNAPKGAQGDGNSFCFFAFCTVAPRQATCCCFSGLFPRKGVHLHASNYWILLLSMMKYSREKKWAKRLPRQCVHSMALGGVIKHMGWKLSRFTLCSQGWCCGFFFFFFGCSCKVKFIHEHKAEANLLLLTCAQHTRQMWRWRCSRTDPEPRPRQAAAPLPPCPSPATRCIPCTLNSVRHPDETPQLHQWLICFPFTDK